MTHVVFIAPLFLETTNRYVEGFANIDNITLSVISQDPESSIPRALKSRVAGHYRVTNTLDAGAGYTTYLWSTGATTRSISVSPTVSQSYTVIGYIGSCPSSQVAYLQQVYTTPNHPVPSSNSPICVGNTLGLSAATTSGATYLWTGPNGFPT